MKTKILQVLLSLFLISSSIFSQQEKINELNKEIEQFQNIKVDLKTLHSNLLELKTNVDDLGEKAKIYQNNNQLKVVIKGLKDLYGLLTDAPSSMFDVVKGSIENLVLEPYFQKARKVKVDVKKFNIERNKYTDEIIKMNSALNLMLKSDLKYFDDDMPYSKFVKKYWRTPDGQPDDETELVTRKLHVIIGLSNDLSDKVADYTKLIRKDFLLFDNMIDDNNRLIKQLGKTLKTNEQIRLSHQKRMKLFEGYNQKEKNKNINKTKNKQTKIDQNSSERAKRHMGNFNDEREGPNDSFIAEKNSRLKYLTRGYEIGKTGKISFTIGENSKLISGWSILFVGDLQPKEALGDLIWKVDDMVVGYKPVESGFQAARNFSYIFDMPGIYDVSVSLMVNGEFIDKYLTQITIEPNKVQKQKERSLSINNFTAHKIKKPKKKSKRQIVNFPYAKYWVSGNQGEEIISGFYFNMMGQKQNYESLKISNYNDNNPTYGLFALKSLNGYHVYTTIENDDKCLLITLLGQKGPEEYKKIENVGYFELNIKPDFSEAVINYKNQSGVQKTINLK